MCDRVSRSFQRWTPAEDAELRERCARHESVAAIGLAMNRGSRGVAWRMKQLKLHAQTWTPEEIDRLRRDWGKVPTRVLSEAFHRQVKAIGQKARQLGLEFGSQLRPKYLPQERELIRAMHATHSAAEIAAELRRRFGKPRNAHGVWARFREMGLRKVEFHPVETIDRVLLAHAEGLPVRLIARRAGLLPPQVRFLLERYGIHRHPDAEARRLNVAKQMRSLGLKNPAGLRSRAYRKFAAARGWPEDLPPRAVQILEMLAKEGRPLDMWTIGDKIGWDMQRAREQTGSLLQYTVRGREGSTYLSVLVKRGLLLCLTRAARIAVDLRDGKPHRRNLYALSPAALAVIESRNRKETNRAQQQSALG